MTVIPLNLCVVCQAVALAAARRVGPGIETMILLRLGFHEGDTLEDLHETLCFAHRRWVENKGTPMLTPTVEPTPAMLEAAGVDPPPPDPSCAAWQAALTAALEIDMHGRCAQCGGPTPAGHAVCSPFCASVAEQERARAEFCATCGHARREHPAGPEGARCRHRPWPCTCVLFTPRTP